jgi:uncharacterized protein (TIGR03437 family)
MIEKSLCWTAVLLVCSVTTAHAQRATLSYVDFDPCCVASDVNGNSFIVSSPTTGTTTPAISVAKVDSTGSVVSTFSFPVGVNDNPAAAAVDPQGDLWIVCSPEHRLEPSAPIPGLVAKLDNNGTSLLFTARFGGPAANGETGINAIAFDPAGNVYLAGYTGQSDFPVTPGAFMSQFGIAPQPAGVIVEGAPQYGFIAKLTPSFTLVYATLLGGNQLLLQPCSGTCYTTPASTIVSALAVDANGVATAAGITDAADFPVTNGAFQTQCQCQYGTNAFITRLNAPGSALVWSTLLGGSSPIAETMTALAGIAVDSSGNVVVAGTTTAPNFPVTSGTQLQDLVPIPNGFVAKLDSSGTNLLFSRYYGGAGVTHLSPPRLDALGDIWISGSIYDRTGLVLAPNSLVLGNSLIAELAPDGSSVLFSELLPNGVAGQDLALNPDASLTAAGPAQEIESAVPIPNGFVLRLPRGEPTGVSILGVADSAINAVSNTVAPGEYVSFYGTGLGPAAEVSFDGIPAPILYAAESQINLLAPYEIAGRTRTNVQISTDAGSSQSLALQVVPVHPNIFVILNSDGTVNSPQNSAPQGSVITILVSGAGVLNASLPDGTIAASPAPAPVAAVQVVFGFSYYLLSQVEAGEQTVTPIYAGGIPGTVVNMLRVDAQMPSVSVPFYGFDVAIQVGSSNSPGFPLYVTGVL